MPGLQSANISAKLLKELGGDSMIGPMLVGMAKPVQFDVGIDHVRADPRAVLARTRRSRAGAHDLGEGGVGTQGPSASA